MVHRSATVAYTVTTISDALQFARVELDRLWGCTPEERPYNIVQAKAQPAEKPGLWHVVVEAEDA